MGIVQKKKTPVELAEEEVEVKQRSSQFVTVKVFFTVRPHLPPCHCAVVSVPLAARASELLDTSWGLFQEYREKMGLFLGPVPSEEINDYMLCFVPHASSQAGYRKFIGELKASVYQARQDVRRRSSAAPPQGPASTGTSPGSGVLDPHPMSIDQLLDGGHDPVNVASMSLSPAASLGLDVPRRRSRSGSVISTSTIVTEESIEDARNNEQDDDDGDDFLSGHGGQEGKVTSIADVVQQEFKHLNRTSQVINKMLPAPKAVCEECPPSAIVSRLVANRLKKRSESGGGAPAGLAEQQQQALGSHQEMEADDGLVSFHVMLKNVFLERESLLLTEEKTRHLISRAFELSWDSLKDFEEQCKEQTKVFEVRRAVELEQLHAFEEKERTIRLKHQRAEHTIWTDAIQAFRKRYNDLEVGMIAQYRQILTLRQKHQSQLRDMGFEDDVEDDA
ncbi:Hypothetical protein, putative [Bodo saltans]|uniref:Uncharacterized protein n=1 Tax=Bodo saltans TaxID=75058 RepID=A0A0S4KNF2_BODSA|nr:Hypothetical protein, putative [Bodo saltans]|eukprot:CUI15150.1 Hypothetical protein, putative [Bodo saltans]